MGRPNLTTNPCLRCGRDSDMTCPREEPLEDYLAALYDQSYVAHHDEIDERFASNQLVRCTNCGGAGCFDYRGAFRPRSVPSDCDLGRQEATYRAFWICRRCFALGRGVGLRTWKGPITRNIGWDD